MINFLIRSLFFLLVVLFIHNCGKETVPYIEIVAQVGDKQLTRDELLKWMPPNIPEEQYETVARQYIDRWMQKTVLYLEAQGENIILSEYEKWSIHNLEKEMIGQKYLDTKFPQSIVVTDEELSKYYESHKDEFIRDRDEVHLIQLFLENRDRAIQGEIRKSSSLLEVIKKNYLDSQGTRLLDKNGDMGYVPVDNLRKEIVYSVKHGKTGRIYGPIRIESGYYYFQMMDKQSEGSYRILDLVRESIKLRILNQKREQISRNIAEKLFDKYSAEVYPEHIK